MSRGLGERAIKVALTFWLIVACAMTRPSLLAYGIEKNSTLPQAVSSSNQEQREGKATAVSQEQKGTKGKQLGSDNSDEGDSSKNSTNGEKLSQTRSSKGTKAIASGTCGSCSWTIDGSGALILAPTEGEMGMLESDSSSWPWLDWKDEITSVAVQGTVVAAEDSRNLFKGCSELKHADLASFDTSNVTKMSSMFEGCSKLEALDLSTFATSNCTTFSSMFRNCSSLSSVDVTSFDTKKATSMINMFSGCTKLRELDLSSFDTGSVKNMQDMFSSDVLLDSFSVGDGWAPVGLFRDFCSPRPNSQNGKWWSVGDRCWYDEDAAFERKGIADTYESTADLSLVEFEPLADQPWLGKAVTPVPNAAVSIETTDSLLKTGQDFTVTYKNNKAEGVATMTVTGKGDYRGSKELQFAIVPPDLSYATVAETPVQLYTGKEVKPKIDVTFGMVSLTEGKDYTLSYEDNIEPGFATVTIAGKGRFTGETAALFEIGPKTDIWVRSGSHWRYRKKDGSYVTSRAVKIDGETYRFDDDGNLRTGWVQEGNNWYWHDSSGVMKTGWQDISGSRFWFDSNGKMATGWKQLDGKTYYLEKDGAAATGWKDIDGSRYWFDSSGAKGAGWQKVAGAWYWLDKDGKTSTGWKEIDGETYYLDKAGAAVTGWKDIDGDWYWFDSSGAKATDWQKVSGSWYWLGEDGKLDTGWQEIEGETYYLEPTGEMATGWEKVDGSWYWFGNSGVKSTGWQKADGSWYWLGDDGKMASGWLEQGKSWYYLKSGAMVTGWQKINGSWYHFSSSGVMSTSRWVDDTYVGSDGAMMVNTRTPSGYWVDGDGHRVVYWVPNGEVYHKNPKCSYLLRSRTILSGTIAESGKSRACSRCG